MRYILPYNVLIDMDVIKKEYQTTKQISLSTPSTLLRWPTTFGGTDIHARKKQIAFLEKIHLILKPNLLKEEEITTGVQLFASLTAARVMLAAALFIKHRIGAHCHISSQKNSILYQLIDKQFAITTTNYLDEEDIEVCVLAAQRITSLPNALEEANQLLRTAQKPIIHEAEWHSFTTFLNNQIINKTAPDFYARYPITNITKNLFGAAGAYTGASIGLLTGELLEHSTQVVSARTKLTVLIGGTFLVFQSAGPAGLALLAPVIAERLLRAFIKISLAGVMSVGMGVAGQGIGIAVGMPLDMTWQLLTNYYKTMALQNAKPTLTGLRIADGAAVWEGIIINELKGADDELLPHDAINIELKDDNLFINGHLIEPEQIVSFVKKHTPSLEQSSDSKEAEHQLACI